jgi:hypothetical protein
VRAFFARLFIELDRLAQLQILEFLADHRMRRSRVLPRKTRERSC